MFQITIETRKELHEAIEYYKKRSLAHPDLVQMSMFRSKHFFGQFVPGLIYQSKTLDDKRERECAKGVFKRLVESGKIPRHMLDYLAEEVP